MILPVSKAQPCTDGDTAPGARVAPGVALAKKRARDRAYSAAHREGARARVAAWRKAHPNALKAWKAAHPGAVKRHKKKDYERHKERILQRQEDQRRSRPEIDRAHHAAYYSKNREKVLRANTVYKETHHEVIQAIQQRHRARKRAARGGCTGSDLHTLRRILGSVCPACKKACSSSIDHVIPLACGGTNQPTNLQFLCRSCNSRKHTTRKDYRTPQQRRAILQAFQLVLL